MISGLEEPVKAPLSFDYNGGDYSLAKNAPSNLSMGGSFDGALSPLPEVKDE